LEGALNISLSSLPPKIRALDMKPVYQRGKAFILLRDPLGLAEEQLIVPQEITPLLMLCDGTRDASALSAALAVRFGQKVTADEIDLLIQALDKAFLLENDRFLDAKEKALLEYRQAPFRQPILAGISYPSEVDLLQEHLQDYIDQEDLRPDPAMVSGLVSPHIDYERGGSVYAKVWGQAQESVEEADLVVILGTDHFGEDNPMTLTRQHYATPFGTLPTAISLVDELASSLDERIAFNGELYHKAEHSIELAAVWLHHIRGGKPCEILPVLCGSFERFIQGETHPEEDLLLKRFNVTLGSAIADRSALIVAAGDMAHVGPAFGGRPLDLMGRARMKAADLELIECMCEGDREGFLQAIRLVEDRNNVCGIPPIYLTLQLLSPTQGEMVAYELCPADQQGSSVVSICGVLFK
jgi:AmmeMemoRadiSam system protein B